MSPDLAFGVRASRDVGQVETGSTARLDGELARPCGDGKVAASVSVVGDAHRSSLPVSAEHIAERACSTAELRVLFDRSFGFSR